MDPLTMGLLTGFKMVVDSDLNTKGAGQNGIANFTNVMQGKGATPFKSLYYPAQTGLNALMGYKADKQKNDFNQSIYDMLNPKTQLDFTAPEGGYSFPEAQLKYNSQYTR